MDEMSKGMSKDLLAGDESCWSRWGTVGTSTKGKRESETERQRDERVSGRAGTEARRQAANFSGGRAT